MELPPCQDGIEHGQIFLTAISIEYRIQHCNEDVTMETQLLIGLICGFSKLDDFIVVDNGEDECYLFDCIGRKALSIYFVVDKAAGSFTFRNAIIYQDIFQIFMSSKY